MNTLAEMRRDLDRLRFVKQQIKEIEKTRVERLAKAPDERRHVAARALTRVVGVGVETADMLVQEVFSREIRDRRALARYAGLTGAPDESGQRRRERGLAKAGNARVRRGMIELAWGHLTHQKGSPLSAWYRMRTADARGGTRKTMIVALARKLLIILWRLATTGEAPEGSSFARRRNHDGVAVVRASPRRPNCRRRTEAAATRRWTMAFAPRFRMGPPLGASPPMRMTASWCDLRGRPNTSS